MKQSVYISMDYAVRFGVPSGASERIRTAGRGVAVPCLTTWLQKQICVIFMAGAKRVELLSAVLETDVLSLHQAPASGFNYVTVIDPNVQQV